MNDWITGLQEDNSRLAGLLSDPQPGLATWHASVRAVAERISGVQPDPGIWAPTEAEKLAAAEAERHELIEAENRRHVNNIQCELRRYEAALAHIESVFLLRTGPAETVSAP